MRLLRYWRRHFLGAEFAVAVAIALTFSIWAARFDGGEMIASTLNGNRGSIYGTAASILGSLLGFTITTLALVLALSSHGRLVLLRESPHYPVIWRVFTSTIHSLGVSTIIVLGALLADRDANSIPILQYAAFGSLVLVVLRLGRSVWILEEVVKLLTQSSKSRTADDV